MNFCTGCGKQVEDQARYCSSCGTPVGSAVSTAQVTSTGSSAAASTQAPEPVQASPPEPQLLMPQSSSGSPVLVVVGILLIVLIGAGVGATLYMRRQPDAKQTPSATVTSSEAPANSSANEPDPYMRNLNLGSYPGATAIAVTDEGAGEVIAAFRTSDTPEQVIGFYKIRFPVSDSNAEEGKSELNATLPNGQQILIEATAQPNGTEVRIIRQR